MPFQVSRLLPFVGVVRVQESTLQTDIKIASPFSKHVHNYMFDLHMPIIFQKFEYSFGLSVSITTSGIVPRSLAPGDSPNFMAAIWPTAQ